MNYKRRKDTPSSTYLVFDSSTRILSPKIPTSLDPAEQVEQVFFCCLVSDIIIIIKIIMQLLSLLSLLGAATLAVGQSDNTTHVTGKLGDARPVRNNPVIGEVWVAKFNGTVQGTVTAVAAAVGVNYLHC
jgi:hypothetical protein